MDLQSFTTFYELLIVFNFAYVGSNRVKNFVNNHIFEIGDRHSDSLATVISKIETVKTISDKDEIDEDYEGRLNEAKRRLKKISKLLPLIKESIDTHFQIIYLIGGLFGVVLLYLSASGNNTTCFYYAFNLSTITLFVLLIISVLIAYNKWNIDNVIVVVLYILVATATFILVYLNVYIIDIDIKEEFVKHLSNFTLVFPFVLNFFVSLSFNFKSFRDTRSANKLAKEDGDLLRVDKMLSKKK